MAESEKKCKVEGQQCCRIENHTFAGRVHDMVCGDVKSADHNSNVMARAPYLYKVPTRYTEPDSSIVDFNFSYNSWYWHCGNDTGAMNL